MPRRTDVLLLLPLVHRRVTNQHDVTLRDHTGRVLFDVPLRADTSLTRRFGSVQFNVHRGELQQALMTRFCAEGGRLQTGCRFSGLEQDDAGVTAHFIDGPAVRGALLVGADGAHSAVRRALYPDHALRYSGFSCWRGIATAGAPELVNHPRVMYKTVAHPSSHDVSFTAGWTTGARCFWVLDVRHPAVSH